MFALSLEVCLLRSFEVKNKYGYVIYSVALELDMILFLRHKVMNIEHFTTTDACENCITKSFFTFKLSQITIWK